MKRWLALLGFAVAIAAGTAAAQDVAPHAIDIPPWFAETFLDFGEDIRDAARDGRRLMVYFGQDGCPYCREFMVTNFSQRSIVEKTRKHEYLSLGVSPRGSMSLYRAAQALALVEGREYVIPDDVKRMAVPVFAHRVVVNTRYATTQKKSAQAESILSEILEETRVPV